MTPRKPRPRKPKTTQALVPASIWVDSEQADWLITTAKAACVPPRFNLGIPRSSDRQYLAGIDIVNAALRMELDQQVRWAREDMTLTALDYHRARVAAIEAGNDPMPELLPAPFDSTFDPAGEEHLANIEAAWREDPETGSAWRMLPAPIGEGEES